MNSSSLPNAAETPHPPSPGHSISPYYGRTIKELRRDPLFGPAGPHFASLVHHYLPLVYGTALKLLPESPDSASRVCQAVFELLSIKWHSLLTGRTVSGWLTALSLWLLRAAVSVSLRERKRLRLPKPPRKTPLAAYFALFKQFFRLPKKSQHGVLTFHIRCLPPASDSSPLAAHQKHAAKALRTLSRKVRKTILGPDISAALAALLAPVPPEIQSDIMDSTQRWTLTAPRADLTRATLIGWRWLALRTFFRRVLATIGGTIALLALLAFTFVQLAQRGYLNNFFIEMGRRDTLKKFPELAEPARPWPVTPEDHALVPTKHPRDSSELYQPTNIWLARLSFTPQDWDAIQPSRIDHPALFQDGKIILRNPKAERSGLAGMLGYHFNWAPAQFQFGGLQFTNAAARYRGNGTYVDSLYGYKQSFKIDLNKFTKKQKLAGLDELNFVNSIPDPSYLHDSMADRFFRDLGVAAPRTAYAYLSVDVPGKWTNQPLGLYNLIENIDSDFAEAAFDTKKVPIFKPVTYQLFHDLGSNWSNYAAIYDLKTEATPAQLQRVADFSRLVTHASDEDFARRLPEFLDLELFASYLAGNVLLSNYDSILTHGQNFFLYLHPRTGRFAFIPWDHDHSWGEFGQYGSRRDREQASIWKPWTYDFRFLERTIAVPAFRGLYQARLKDALDRLFTTDRLYPQIDQLAAAIRPAIAAESQFRLRRFEKAVSSEFDEAPHDQRDRAHDGPNSRVHQIKRFIANRIISVRAQLDGTSVGVELRRR